MEGSGGQALGCQTRGKAKRQRGQKQGWGEVWGARGRSLMARRGPSRGQPQSGRGGEQPLVLCWGETAGGGGGSREGSSRDGAKRGRPCSVRGDRARPGSVFHVRRRHVPATFHAGPGEPDGPVVIKESGLHLILKVEPSGFAVRSGVTPGSST